MFVITYCYGIVIQMDPSKSLEFKCNDHLDRAWLHFKYENKSEIFENGDELLFHYSYQPCFESDTCVTDYLTKINSNTSTLKLIINSAYMYKIEVTTNQKFKNISNNRICENLDFYQFVECGQYDFNFFSNGSCTITLVSNEMEYSIVKYVYLFFGLSLSLVVMAKLIKATFFRYQLIK